VAATLSCRLPISNGQPGSGGFVIFPSAKFQADPASGVRSDAVYGMSFDLAAGKWLPVPRSYISPDGTRYAYWDWQSRSIVAVSVANGAETQIGDDNGLWLATSDGLYLSTSFGTEKVGTVTGQLGGGCH
jgi:hypothetical protein